MWCIKYWEKWVNLVVAGNLLNKYDDESKEEEKINTDESNENIEQIDILKKKCDQLECVNNELKDKINVITQREKTAETELARQKQQRKPIASLVYLLSDSNFRFALICTLIWYSMLWLI